MIVIFFKNIYISTVSIPKGKSPSKVPPPVIEIILLLWTLKNYTIFPHVTYLSPPSILPFACILAYSLVKQVNLQKKVPLIFLKRKP